MRIDAYVLEFARLSRFYENETPEYRSLIFNHPRALVWDCVLAVLCLHSRFSDRIQTPVDRAPREPGGNLLVLRTDADENFEDDKYERFKA